MKAPTSKEVIKCLEELFRMFGPPSYIHSDRGSQFNKSQEFEDFLDEWNIWQNANHAISSTRKWSK